MTFGSSLIPSRAAFRSEGRADRSTKGEGKLAGNSVLSLFLSKFSKGCSKKVWHLCKLCMLAQETYSGKARMLPHFGFTLSCYRAYMQIFCNAQTNSKVFFTFYWFNSIHLTMGPLDNTLVMSREPELLCCCSRWIPALKFLLQSSSHSSFLLGHLTTSPNSHRRPTSRDGVERTPSLSRSVMRGSAPN